MIVIPDIHGRSFWKQAVELFPDDKIIFLGDYLDPYPYEGLDFQNAWEQINAVIDLKRRKGNQVILLLGNHDVDYLFPHDNHSSRHDFDHEEEVERLLMNNIDLFKITHIEKIAQKTYLFSHAGLLPGWIKCHIDLFSTAQSFESAANLCNDLLQNKRFQNALYDVSKFRYGPALFGSVLWADENEFENNPPVEGTYQIFGHSQQKESPIITRNFACLDCRMAFRLDERNGFISAIDNTRSILDHDEMDNNISDETRTKIIFLDFDGVMHSLFYDNECQVLGVSPIDKYGPLFDPNCIECLKQIIDSTDAKIVISSTWKESMSLAEIQQMWSERDLPGEVIGTTPRTGGNRGDEIQEWLNLHPQIRYYIILDDMDASAFLPYQISHLININPYTGLDEDNEKRASVILN